MCVKQDNKHPKFDFKVLMSLPAADPEASPTSLCSCSAPLWLPLLQSGPLLALLEVQTLCSHPLWVIPINKNG